jgi:hypothetical protein
MTDTVHGEIKGRGENNNTAAEARAKKQRVNPQNCFVKTDCTYRLSGRSRVSNRHKTCCDGGSAAPGVARKEGPWLRTSAILKQY